MHTTHANCESTPQAGPGCRARNLVPVSMFADRLLAPLSCPFSAFLDQDGTDLNQHWISTEEQFWMSMDEEAWRLRFDD